MIGRLREVLTEEMSAKSLPNNILNDMPYSVWSIDDLEVGMQIINVVGVQDYMEGKINDPKFEQWDWHGYRVDRFKHGPNVKALFADEFETIFSGLGV